MPSHWFHFFRVDVVLRDKSKSKYYVMVFNDHADLLNRNKSILVDDDFVVKAVLDRDKISSLNVSPIPGSGFRFVLSSGIVEEKIKI